MLYVDNVLDLTFVLLNLFIKVFKISSNVFLTTIIYFICYILLERELLSHSA